jgi:hypothetical protein
MAVSAGPALATDTDIVQVFVTSGTFTPSFTGTVEVLVVAGGGGGGSDMGGGGGGGGVISNTRVAVTANTPITVTVGAGGTGAPAGTGGHATTKGTNGGNSVFGSDTAVGGGAGGCSYYTFGTSFGNSGGSGGGGSGYNNGVTPALSTGTGYGASGTGTAGQGNRGGWGNSSYYSGGGGGAGGAGTDANAIPNGGPGIVNTILNQRLFWGGGGGGAAYSVSPGGSGGIGGGGGGAIGTTTGGAGYNNGSPGGGGAPGTQANTPGGNGGQNTGGGGGGGAHYNFTNQGGTGGSGIVIVRYSASLGSSTGGAPISLADMSLCMDAANPQSNLGNRSIINWGSWTTGSGSVTGYSQNGQTAENERIIATDPWGNNSIVWEARPLAQNNDDGGWNTTDFAIDNTQLYRFSVWVRRISSGASGNFYLGMYANGDGSRRTDNNTVEGNAYWQCSAASGLAQNTWYLFVGHVYPANTTFTGRNPDTGYYTINGRAGNIDGCNIGSGDLKWSYNSTTGTHRTYLFYATDSTTRLQFLQPRVDLCDGTQPSVQELLSNAGSIWYDVSGNDNNCRFGNFPTPSTGFYTFNGTTNNGTVPTLQTFGNNTTWEAWVYCEQDISTYNMFMGRYLPYFSFFGGNRLYFSNNVNGSQQTIQTSSNLSLNTWYQATFTTSFDGTNTTMKIFTNGVETATGTFTGPQGQYTGINFMVGDGNDGSNGSTAWYPFKGRVSNVKVYNRTLSLAEIQQNFNAVRGRYGV